MRNQHAAGLEIRGWHMHKVVPRLQAREAIEAATARHLRLQRPDEERIIPLAEYLHRHAILALARIRPRIAIGIYVDEIAHLQPLRWQRHKAEVDGHIAVIVHAEVVIITEACFRGRIRRLAVHREGENRARNAETARQSRVSAVFAHVIILIVVRSGTGDRNMLIQRPTFEELRGRHMREEAARAELAEKIASLCIRHHRSHHRLGHERVHALLVKLHRHIRHALAFIRTTVAILVDEDQVSDRKRHLHRHSLHHRDVRLAAVKIRRTQAQLVIAWKADRPSQTACRTQRETFRQVQHRRPSIGEGAASGEEALVNRIT